MCRILEEMCEAAAEKAAVEASAQTLKDLIQKIFHAGQVPPETIAQWLDMPLEDVRRMAAELGL